MSADYELSFRAVRDLTHRELVELWCNRCDHKLTWDSKDEYFCVNCDPAPYIKFWQFCLRKYPNLPLSQAKSMYNDNFSQARKLYLLTGAMVDDMDAVENMGEGLSVGVELGTIHLLAHNILFLQGYMQELEWPDDGIVNKLSDKLYALSCRYIIEHS